MTPDNPDDQQDSLSTRLSRRRVLLGAAAGAGVLVVLPVSGAVGAPFALLHDDHDDGKLDDDGDDDKLDDDDDNRDSSGDDDQDDHATQEATGNLPTGATEVRIDDDDEDGFSPGSVDIEVGQSVTFVNDDDEQHTATSVDWDTGIIEPGESATIAYDQAGSFPYSCRIHPVMTGVVNVHDPDATPMASPEASPVGATPTTMAGMTVAILDFEFDPQEIEVPAGTPVTWTNGDTVPHTATSVDGAFDTGTLGNGESGSHTFEAPGRFDYQCEFHPNMAGTVVVT